jgi:hypothetical protein
MRPAMPAVFPIKKQAGDTMFNASAAAIDRLLTEMFEAAIASGPAGAVPPGTCRHRRAAALLVIGAGKASAEMARAVEDTGGPLEGLVVTRYGYAVPCGASRSSRRPTRCRTRPAAPPRRMLELRERPDGGRPGALPDLRRRLALLPLPATA